MASSFYSKLGDRQLLHRAWTEISKSNRQSRGIDNETIAQFKQNVDGRLVEIARELKAGTYTFSPTRGVPVPKPDGGKRPIQVPAVKDRVVMKAIAILIEPKFSKFTSSCSHGYIRGRSVRTATDDVLKYFAKGNPVVLEADIANFFGTIDRELLLGNFLAQIKTKSLIPLIQQALSAEVGNLDSFGLEDRALFPASTSGVPQGGILSPMLANFYLYPFDKGMTEANFNLVRYADDFVVMCKDEGEAESAYKLAREILEDQLKLTLHKLGTTKTRILRVNKGFDFLGLRFSSAPIRPSDRTLSKLKTRIDQLFSQKENLTLTQIAQKLRGLLHAWGDVYVHFDSKKCFALADQHVTTRLSEYLRKNNLLKDGFNVTNRQKRKIGIPRLYGYFKHRG
jgi:RNA-directed DNA polymerase